MWDEGAAPRQPFARRPEFVVLAVVLVAAAAALGVLLGRQGGGKLDTVTGPAAPSSGPQADLLGRLPPSIYTGCTGGDLQPGQDAALRCDSAVPGADTLLVAHFTDAATMAADFRSRYTARYADGKCGTFTGGTEAKGKGVSSTWDGGPLACYVNSNGDAALLWEYRNLAVQVIAVAKGPESAALFRYWEGLDKTLS